jgi:DNA-directed RNA polymerase alpha subunit
MPIEALTSPCVRNNCLKRESYDTVRRTDFVDSRPTSLDIRNFGRKSVDEVKEKSTISAWVLSLKDSTGGFDAGAVVDAAAQRLRAGTGCRC